MSVLRRLLSTFCPCQHRWRAPTALEKFPVCTRCGRSCWYLRGYRMNSGTQLGPDYAALALMADDDPRLDDVPWMSIPHEPWTLGKPSAPPRPAA